MMQISIVGGGYVGLVTGACFAHLGHYITIIDIDADKVHLINNGQSPIYEIGLEQLIKQHIGSELRASTKFDSIASAEVIFICVGTPQTPNNNIDLSFIKSACSSIGMSLTNNISECCVIIKSTVLPGTTENIIRPEILTSTKKSENEINFIVNPEFLREGKAIEDFMHPDRIIIGNNESYSKYFINELYEKIPAPIIYTDIPTAEMIKYTSNAFLATKISFANEIGNICKHLHINAYDVMKGVGLDHRIGSQFLNAGIGFGGSCFYKDLSALILLAQKNNENPILLQSIIDINTRQPHKLIALLENKIGDVSDKYITLLGLAFKNDTDDIRESRAIPIIRELLQKKAHLAVYDPMAMTNMRQIFPDIKYCNNAIDALTNADGCLVLTEWTEFSKLDTEFDVMKHKVIIAGRKILTCKGVEGICW
jgi:UDPglucose 6-dehydrogenase